MGREGAHVAVSHTNSLVPQPLRDAVTQLLTSALDSVPPQEEGSVKGGERGEREASSPEGGGKEPCRESGPALHRLEPSHLVPSPLRPDAPAASVLRCGMLSGDPVRCGPEGSLRHQLGRAEPVPRGWPADSLATPTSPPGAHTRALSLCRSTLSFLLVSYGFYYRS